MNTVTITFEDISLSTKENFLFKKSKLKQILKNINGEFRGGELTAIIGRSGSGKSSLLDCLSGIHRGNFTGTILMNKIEVNLERIKEISSYVMQEQDFHMLLTINEIMTLSLNLKNKSNLTKLEKQTRIKKILEKLKISRKCDTFVRELSGGECKRFQVAIELVHDPKIIFLDEPLSGLDSVASTKCIEILKQLANEGHTIICSIHQPTALILEYFNQIYAIEGGNCIYQGSPSNIIPFLRELDLICPKSFNPTDFLLEIANGDYGEQNERLIGKIENGKNENYRCKNWKRENCENFTIKNEKVAEHSTNYFVQVYYLVCRIYLMSYRDKTLFAMRISIHLMVGVLFGLIYMNIGNVGHLALINYRSIVANSFTVLYTSYHSHYITFPLEFKIIKREYLNGWYSTGAYYSALLLSDIPITFFCCFSFVSITYWMTNQPRELYRFVIYLGFIIVMSFASQALGIMVTSLLNVKNAMIYATFVLVSFSLVICIKPSDSHQMFQIIFDGNFFVRTSNSILYSVFGYNRTRLDCDTIYCHFDDPKVGLREAGLEHEDEMMMKNFNFIVANVIAFHTVAFLMIKHRLKYR